MRNKVENFPFWFFEIMFFGQNLTVGLGGGGRVFSLRCTMGWTIIFFEFFQKKLSLCTMGKIDFFWKLDLQWDEGSFFLFFLQKSCHHILWGKCTFFPRHKLAIYTMVKTCVFYNLIFFVRFHITIIILVMLKWLLKNGV